MAKIQRAGSHSTLGDLYTAVLTKMDLRPGASTSTTDAALFFSQTWQQQLTLLQFFSSRVAVTSTSRTTVTRQRCTWLSSRDT